MGLVNLNEGREENMLNRFENRSETFFRFNFFTFFSYTKTVHSFVVYFREIVSKFEIVEGVMR